MLGARRSLRLSRACMMRAAACLLDNALRGTEPEDIEVRPWVVCQEPVLGLAGYEVFESEFDGHKRPSDHRVAGQDLGIQYDALRKQYHHQLTVPARGSGGRLRQSSAVCLIWLPNRHPPPWAICT